MWQLALVSPTFGSSLLHDEISLQFKTITNLNTEYIILMLKVLFRLFSIQLMWPLRKMSRYLKHFTAVGDEQSTAGQWHEEEPHDASEDIELATGQHLDQLSFRDSLRRLYRTERFQVNDHTLDMYMNIYIHRYIFFTSMNVTLDCYFVD